MDIIEQHIQDIRAAIQAGRFSNEASVSQGIVLRLLQTLAWNTYDTQVVCPEYKLQGRRVDYALCHPASKPIAFIEVKQIGQSEGAEKQLFEYAFHVGVPLAILTDGREWHFFLPAAQGNYDERRVYKLDIMQRDLAECAARLTRYLHYDAIASGAAIAAAREDHSNVERNRRIEETLPQAWQKLIAQEDAALLELVAERVESLCGFRPDLKTVAGFLKGEKGSPATSTKSDFATPPKTSTVEKPTLLVWSIADEMHKQNPNVTRKQVIDACVAQGIADGTAQTQYSKWRKANGNATVQENPVHSTSPVIGFTLHGQHYPAKSGREVMTHVFEILIQRDAAFAQRFADLPKHGRTRRYLAKTAEELNPNRFNLLDFTQEFALKLSSGWWLSINHSHTDIEKIIKLACDVAQLQYGKDLIIHLGA